MDRSTRQRTTVQLPINSTRERRRRSTERDGHFATAQEYRSDSHARKPDKMYLVRNRLDSPIIVNGYEKYQHDKIFVSTGDDPTANLVDGSQPPVKAPPDPGKLIYRVRGIPANQNRDEAVAFLKRILRTPDVVIDSLARDASGRPEKVATVRFPTALPSVLSNGAEACTVHDDVVLGRTASTVPIDIDRHFNGLTPLYTPDDEKSHELDFIAIHGLAGYAIGSFKDRTPKSSYVWLRDSLPADLPHARIMTYGYNAKLAKSESFATIDDMAAKFCRLLRDARSSEKSSRKPIIFAAHSLGGLVLKSALGQMKEGSKEDQMNLHSTRGILCFGVPSQGMETKQMRAIIQGQENESLLMSLNHNSRALEPLHDRFLAAFTFEDSKIISFYETELSSTVKVGPSGPERTGEAVVLVNVRSARNGRPKLDPEPIPINKDHSNLVKFTYRDEHYAIVKNEIIDLAKDAVSIIQTRLEHFEQTLLDSDRLDIPMVSQRISSTFARMPSPSPISPRLSQASTMRDLEQSSTLPVLNTERQVEILLQLMRARQDVVSKDSRERALAWAVEANEPDIVEFLLNRNTDPDTTAGISEMPVLCMAAAACSEEVVQILLSRGADPNASGLSVSRTPLYFAAGHGKKSLVRRLIHHGAKPSGNPKPDLVHTYSFTKLDGFSPLYNATQFCHRDVVETLLDYGADPYPKDMPGNVVHAAVYFGKIEILEVLKRKGIDFSSSGSADGYSLIHTAVSGNQADMVAHLIDQGYSPNELDKSKTTPLYYACIPPDLKVCEVLLKRGADHQKLDEYGTTAMQMALQYKSEKLVSLLLDHGIGASELDQPRSKKSKKAGINRFGRRPSPYGSSTSSSEESSSVSASRRRRRGRRRSRSLDHEETTTTERYGNWLGRSDSSRGRRRHRSGSRSGADSFERDSSTLTTTRQNIIGQFHMKDPPPRLRDIALGLLGCVVGTIFKFTPRFLRPNLGFIMYRDPEAEDGAERSPRRLSTSVWTTGQKKAWMFT